LATPNGKTNQLWQTVNDRFYIEGFISKSSGKWLTLNGLPCTDGTSLKQTTNKFLTSQRLSNITSGKLKTIGDCSKYLKADAISNNVVVGTDDNTDTFKWVLEAATCPAVNCPPLSPILGDSTICLNARPRVKLTGPAVKENAAWGISDAGILAGINADGYVTGLKAGTVTVTFQVIEGACLNSVTKTITIKDCSNTSIDSTKCYRIVNITTGKLLEVKDASQKDSAIVQQSTPNGGANQFWKLKQLSNGNYTIASKNSGKLIDILDNNPRGNCIDGIITQQFPADGTNSQNWLINKQADGSYRLVNQTCNKPLRANPTNNVVEIATDAGTSEFNWSIEETPCPTISLSFDPLKCYRLTARHSSKIMEIASNSTDDLINIQQGTWANLPRQVWRIKAVDGSFGVFYNLVNGFSGKLADVRGASLADGANIAQYPKNNGDNQKWQFTKNADGYYVITAKHSGKTIDVKGVSSADGANIQQYGQNGGKNQQWTVGEIGCPTGTVALLAAQIYTADGYREAHKALITWVSNAANADYFTVEKLDKNGNFETLDKINAKPISNVSDKNYYVFTDNQPFEGENTYRIGIVSDNVPPQYSNVISLNFNKMMDFTLYPNPTSEYIDVDLKPYENRPVVLSIMDATGHEIKSISLEKAAKTQRIDLEGFTNGLYLVRIHTAGKRDVTRLFNRMN
jgi:Ricin-type beta-trefoil lectin domain-like/Secretion system C-terminal sorting domain